MQRAYFRLRLPILDNQSSHRHRQLETPWSGTAGVEVENAVTRFIFGDVTVAGYNDRKSGGLRLQINLGELVQNVDRDPGNFERLCFRELARPCSSINVAADRCYGSDFLELGENLRRADIAGVNDVIGAAQQLDRFGTQQPVRIGDDANNSSRLPVLSFQFCTRRPVLGTDSFPFIFSRNFPRLTTARLTVPWPIS